jgi:hypothetical protein
MNQTLTSLVNDVFTLTNRPDLVSETTLAVRNATLKAHSSDFYAKDLFETGIQFDYDLAQQSLEYKQLIPRWRALKYIRKCTENGVPREFLDLITPEEILDSYNATRSNVVYLAGVNLQIRTNCAWKYFLLACYLHPDVTPDKYCSWIAQDNPAAIQYEAAATVFKTIGYDEQAATYRQMVVEEYSLLKASNIIANGY